MTASDLSELDLVEYELHQDGLVVASVYGPKGLAISSILHYRRVYSQDSACEIYEVRKNRKRVKVDLEALPHQRST